MGIVQQATERISKVLDESGLVQRGGTTVSSIALEGGTASAGATLILDDSTDGSGTEKWRMRAPQYGCTPHTFIKPIKFVHGCYATLAGTGEILSIAYT